MNKKRIYRSSDAIIGGVCGGIAEYFDIDPTLVRILAVVICILGLGFPALLYIVCLFAFPPDPGVAQGYVDAQAETREAPCKSVYSNVTATAPAPVATDKQPPPPDPTTRVTAASAQAPFDSTANNPTGPGYVSADASGQGSTGYEANTAQSYSHWTHTEETPKRRKSGIIAAGAILIGIGVIALLCNFIHVSIWRFWPLILVVVGLVHLFSRGPRGWSLERAGSAIVLITVGFALLLWMLQIVQTRAFVAAFVNLWPALLIVAGLTVIGGAKGSSVITLCGSLVFSATILLGILFYAGINWADLGMSAFIIESDGVQEFFADVVRIR